MVRTNIITGRIEGWSTTKHRWETLGKNISIDKDLKEKWSKVINDPRYKDATPEVQSQIKEDWFKHNIESSP